MMKSLFRKLFGKKTDPILRIAAEDLSIRKPTRAEKISALSNRHRYPVTVHDLSPRLASHGGRLRYFVMDPNGVYVDVKFSEHAAIEVACQKPNMSVVARVFNG